MSIQQEAVKEAQRTQGMTSLFSRFAYVQLSNTLPTLVFIVASLMLVLFVLELVRLLQIFMIKMQYTQRKLLTKDNLLEILVQNQQDDIMLDSVEQENFILHQNQNINCLDQPNYAGTGGNNFIFYNSFNNLDTSLNDEQRRTAPFDGYLETMGTT